MTQYDYDRWDNFTKEDLECSQTGNENPNVEAMTDLMDMVQELRTWAGVPFYVSSAYRSPEHPIEARKIAKGKKAGQHSKAAIDFRVSTADCYRIVAKAFEMGFTGIGINLTGDAGSRFIHLDLHTSAPRIWSY